MIQLNDFTEKVIEGQFKGDIKINKLKFIYSENTFGIEGYEIYFEYKSAPIYLDWLYDFDINKVKVEDIVSKIRYEINYFNNVINSPMFEHEHLPYLAKKIEIKYKKEDKHTYLKLRYIYNILVNKYPDSYKELYIEAFKNFKS